MLPTKENPVVAYDPIQREQRENKGLWYFEVATFKGIKHEFGRDITDYTTSFVGHFATEKLALEAKAKYD